MKLFTLFAFMSLVISSCTTELKPMPLEVQNTKECEQALQSQSYAGIDYVEGKIVKVLSEDFLPDRIKSEVHYELQTKDHKIYKINNENIAANLVGDDYKIVKMTRTQNSTVNIQTSTNQVIQENCSKNEVRQFKMQSNSSKRKGSVALFYLDGKDNQNTRDTTIQEIEEDVRGFLNHFGRGEFDVKVNSYRIVVSNDEIDCYTRSASFDTSRCKSLFRTKVYEFQKKNKDKHRYTMMMYPWRNASWCGQSEGSTNHIYCLQSNTVLHELGHSLGWMHAADKRYEYGDTDSIMGLSQGKTKGIWTPNYLKIGLNDPQTTLKVEQTQKVFMTYLETKNQNKDVKQFVSAMGDREVFFSMRTENEQFGNTSANSNRIYVHSNNVSIVRDKVQGYIDTVSEFSMTPGMTFRLYGLVIEYIRFENGVAELDIYTNQFDNKPAAEEFPSLNGTSPAPLDPEAKPEPAPQVKPIKINLSRVGINSPHETGFNKERDTQFIRVSNVTRDALTCTEVYAPTMYINNLGRCKLSSNYTSPKNVYQYNTNKSQWTLVTKLADNPYMINGTYTMYWMDPNTKQKAQVTYTVIAQLPKPVIKVSKRCVACAGNLNFTKATDTIHYEIKYAGPNAQICIELESSDKKISTLGRCQQVSSDTYKTLGGEWKNVYNIWSLSNKLKDNPFAVQGMYKLFIYNPDNKKRSVKKFYIN